MVLTGDSLLVGDVGRPDFGGGSASAQYNSINRLLRLPDWVAVFPGHFEGPCGKGMCGRPNTTVGFERLYNPLLHLDQDPFVDTLSATLAARPLNITAIEATNRGLADMPWAMLTTTQHVDEISPDQLDLDNDSQVLIDVREPEEFEAGHVAGSVLIPQADIATRLEEIPRDRPVVAVCRSGSRSLRAAQFLKQMGYSQVFSLHGGVEAWEQAGRPLAGSNGSAAGSRIVETEWMHAGGAR